MSRRKDIFSWGLVVLILILVGATAFYVMLPQLQPHATVHIGDGVFTARVAKTDEERQKGLSGTSVLKSDQALLLVFGSDAKWPIWMKDMNYPIDIVWLDKDKKVVYIVKNASPDSYPDMQFQPKLDSRYVIELAAGTVSQKSIVIDKIAVFDESNLEGWGQ